MNSDEEDCSYMEVKSLIKHYEDEDEDDEEIGRIESAASAPVSIERPIVKTIYSMEITNGYVFRQIFELYDKFVNQGIPFFFKEDGIIIRTGTSGTRNERKLISDIEIFSDDIIEYYLNPELATQPATEDHSACCVEQFNINMIKNILKSITKSYSIRIFKTTDSDDIQITMRSVTTESARIPPSRYQAFDYDFTAFEKISSTPNIKIEINQFCVNLKSMTRGDIEYTSFKVFPHSLLMEGCNTGGEGLKNAGWGPEIEKDHTEDDYFETKVNTSIIKALFKINSMTYNSIVKVYSEQKGYLKLSHRISDFGEHNIYLIDNS
jgi:hypothetical protein